MHSGSIAAIGAARTGKSKDLFEKCSSFTRPADLQAAGLYMYFEVFGQHDGCGPGEIRMGDRKVLMFGSNDYLDLITHPKILEAAQVLGGAGAVRAQDADPMRFVDVRTRVILSRQLDDARKLRQVAFHAEYTLGND